MATKKNVTPVEPTIEELEAEILAEYNESIKPIVARLKAHFNVMQKTGRNFTLAMDKISSLDEKPEGESKIDSLKRQGSIAKEIIILLTSEAYQKEITKIVGEDNLSMLDLLKHLIPEPEVKK